MRSNCHWSACHRWSWHHQRWHGQHFSIEINFCDFDLVMRSRRKFLIEYGEVVCIYFLHSNQLVLSGFRDFSHFAFDDNLWDAHNFQNHWCNLKIPINTINEMASNLFFNERWTIIKFNTFFPSYSCYFRVRFGWLRLFRAVHKLAFEYQLIT